MGQGSAWGMKAVVQEHPMGCGIACVACVSGVSYSDAFKVVLRRSASTRGYFCRELVQALSRLRFEYDCKKANAKTRKHIKKEGTIVFIAPSKRYPKGHYLAKTKKGWMNPWVNFPCIVPAKAGFNKKLPGKALWVIFESKN